MNYVEKFVDGVHYVFNLNAATLSGAIDILVIPQPDGTLKCTPFHVRFGKLQLISSSEKVVQIYVNQKKTDLQMKLGHAGEAFFVEETEEPVPSILATSPITSPKPGRVIKQSTEELLPEFTSTRIMTKPAIKPTPTPATLTTSVTVNNSVSSATPSTTVDKPVVLTDAIQEMIIAQHKQHQQKQQQLPPSAPLLTDKSKSSTPNTSNTKLVASPQPQTNQQPLTPTKKKQTESKRTSSSPIYFEGSEDNIQMDSPLNSFIINCEPEQLTPQDSQSPVGSPSTNLSPPKPMEMLPNPSTLVVASEGSSTSDTESEPKVGFWRWGGLPIFRRNKQPPPPQPSTAAAAPAAAASATTTTITTITTTPTNTTTTSTTIVPPPVVILPQPSSSSSLSGSTKSSSAIVNQHKLSDNDEVINIPEGEGGDVVEIDPVLPTTAMQQQEQLVPTVNEPDSNDESKATNSDSSSWSRMGFLTKMFNKKEAEPSFLVKAMDSPPPSIASETKASVMDDDGVDTNNITKLHINNKAPIRSSDGESGIFLLDEEEEEVAKQEKENGQLNGTTNVNNKQENSVESHTHKFDVSAGKSFASIVKENLNDNQSDTKERAPSPMVPFDDKEFPSLNDGANVGGKHPHHHNHKEPHHEITIPTPNNTPNTTSSITTPTSAPSLYSSSPNGPSFASKANHNHHIEQLSMKQKQSTTGSRPSSPTPTTSQPISKTTTAITTISTPLTKEETDSLPIVKLSLCGHLILDRNLQSDWPEEREKFFNEHIVTFEQLSNDAGIFKNPHLVAKIGVEFYPWSVAGHIIMTQIVFNRSLTKESLEGLVVKDKEERQQTIKPAAGGSNKSWKNWLSWKSNPAAPTTAAAGVSSGDEKSKQLQQANVSSPPIKGQNNSADVVVQPSSKGSGYIKKSLRPTSEQLKALGLQKGANRITFVVSSTLQGTREVSASIYFWENTSKIIISDIDGTITKSDALGQVLPLIGKDWSHLGVAELYSNIKENGYQIMYLTSRAIGQAGLTRTYISSLKQSSSSAIHNPNTNPNNNITTTATAVSTTNLNNNQLIQPTNLNTTVIVNNNNTNNNNNNMNGQQPQIQQRDLLSPSNPKIAVNGMGGSIVNIPTQQPQQSSPLSQQQQQSSPLSQQQVQPPATQVITTTTTTTATANATGVTTSSGVIGISSSSAQGLFTLPEGPVFMSPNRLLTSFNREVIKKNPEEFKIACLQDIQNIFPPGSQPFYAGFGNRSTDATAYNAVGIPNGKIFTINHDGIINTNNNTYNKTYTKINELVQDMFPHAKTSVDEQWNEFHYWRKTRVLPVSKLEPL